MNKIIMYCFQHANYFNIKKYKYYKIITLSCSIFTNRFTTRVRRDSEIYIFDFIQSHICIN